MAQGSANDKRSMPHPPPPRMAGRNGAAATKAGAAGQRGSEATRQPGNEVPAGSAPRPTSVSIIVPLGPPAELNQYSHSGHVEMRLKGLQREAMYRLLAGLREQHVCLSGGTHVENVPDVIRWMMEQAAAGMAGGK